MSYSVRHHRQQPTRLPRPWDSPGKNTGVGCHFLLQCMKVKSESEVAQSCLTPRDPMDCSLPGSSVHGIFQARVLEWGAIAFYLLMSAMSIFIFPVPSALSKPVSASYSTSSELSNPGIEPGSSALQADSLLSPPCIHHSPLQYVFTELLLCAHIVVEK